MGVEIERKFLLKNDIWEGFKKGKITIKQGYLNSDIERTVRVRLFGTTGFITVKGKVNGLSRPEFEYEIPYKDAVTLLTLCEQPIIEKIRYYIHQGDLVWEIDVFEGDNEGLVVAEIELTSETQSFYKPTWLGEEVSDDAKYYNSSLIKHPYQMWCVNNNLDNEEFLKDTE
jgi:adenylate cyclase|tara:strand:- start:42 stop:554 length:513 start_codon:yes stop_codon:yes gene_type:complete